MKKFVTKKVEVEVPFDITYLKKLIENDDPVQFKLPEELDEFQSRYPEISKQEILDNLEQIQEFIDKNYECCKYNDLMYEVENFILNLRDIYNYDFTKEEIIQAVTEYLN